VLGKCQWYQRDGVALLWGFWHGYILTRAWFIGISRFWFAFYGIWSLLHVTWINIEEGWVGSQDWNVEVWLTEHHDQAIYNHLHPDCRHPGFHFMSQYVCMHTFENTLLSSLLIIKIVTNVQVIYWERLQESTIVYVNPSRRSSPSAVAKRSTHLVTPSLVPSTNRWTTKLPDGPLSLWSSNCIIVFTMLWSIQATPSNYVLLLPDKTEETGCLASSFESLILRRDRPPA